MENNKVQGNAQTYVTIVEITKEDGNKSLVNLFAGNPEEAFTNAIQVSNLYKQNNNVSMEIIGTYVKANLKVVDYTQGSVNTNE